MACWGRDLPRARERADGGARHALSGLHRTKRVPTYPSNEGERNGLSARELPAAPQRWPDPRLRADEGRSALPGRRRDRDRDRVGVLRCRALHGMSPAALAGARAPAPAPPPTPARGRLAHGRSVRSPAAHQGVGRSTCPSTTRRASISSGISAEPRGAQWTPAKSPRSRIARSLRVTSSSACSSRKRDCARSAAVRPIVWPSEYQYWPWSSTRYVAFVASRRSASPKVGGFDLGGRPLTRYVDCRFTFHHAFHSSFKLVARANL